MNNYVSTNPATGTVVAEYPLVSDADVTNAVARAHAAYEEWRTIPVEARAAVLGRTAEVFRARENELATILTEEMGKPISEARGEVQLVASIFDYYAQQGPGMLEDEPLAPASGDTAYVRLTPTGVLLGIMPWNYPYYQVARFVAPNLLLGNTVLLKHARNCPRSALALVDVFREAGFPDDAYINVFADSSQLPAVIADPRVQGVSLTGSERAGAAVGETAGRHMKKVVLELGGADPFLVLDGEALERTVKAAVVGRMANAGQACTAAKRFIVVDEVFDAFVEQFAAAVEELVIGDPLDPATQLGPLSSDTAVSDLTAQVEDAINKGATAVTGGGPLPGPGSYFAPTVLTNLKPEMRAYTEELFGPAAIVLRASSVEHAIELANESPYGLGSAVFTQDHELAATVADRLDTGMVTINGTSRSQPDLPFGGVKLSGVGRELGRYGIEEFANRKLIRIPAPQTT